VLKDDMKGLGFNKAKDDEVTGLDVFSDLLSRLNGKSEESIESDKQAKLAVKTNFYVEQKYGAMRFVRGGLLVGDKVMEETKKSKEDSEGDVKMEDTATESDSKKSKKDKKRKAIEDDEEKEDDDDDSSKKSKKRRKDDDESRKSKKKSKKSKSAPVSEDEDDLSEKKKRKSKKSKSDSEDDKVKEAKKQAKKEKKEKKKEKKEKKKEKKRRKEAESSDSDSDSSASSASEKNTTGSASTPAASGSGVSTPLGSRNFVRSRFIAQKKQAVLDAKALNQVCFLIDVMSGYYWGG
jgi:Pin2-interacting protein X1